MAEKLDPSDIQPIIHPRWLREGGVTIEVPTPTGINMPNPWKPDGDGSDGTGASGETVDRRDPEIKSSD